MDMTQFGNILQKCRNLSISDSDWIKKLDTLALDMSQETFNVCIVGGFSHGKTHLLNELLGTDVFPENVLPTTTVLTRVSYGEKTDLVFKSGAEKTDYEFCRENLDLFCAGIAWEDAVVIL
ncbi:MAG: dynamin family protein, partial [Desulfovibrio sp.]